MKKQKDVSDVEEYTMKRRGFIHFYTHAANRIVKMYIWILYALW